MLGRGLRTRLRAKDGQIVRIQRVCIDSNRRVYSNDDRYLFMTPDLHSCSGPWCIYQCTRRLRVLPDWHNIVGSVTFRAVFPIMEDWASVV